MMTETPMANTAERERQACSPSVAAPGYIPNALQPSQRHDSETLRSGADAAPRRSYFVFDVESIGLHGDGFAVGGGLYCDNGVALWEFRFACPTEEAQGPDESRQWVKDNVPHIEVTHRSPLAMRDAFWDLWLRAKANNATMAADCGWPVEARFLEACIADSPQAREWQGPYPLLEISTLMLAAGRDPLGTYERTESEKPAHDPLTDSRQSARLLGECLATLRKLASDFGGERAKQEHSGAGV